MHTCHYEYCDGDVYIAYKYYDGDMYCYEDAYMTL